MAQNYVNCGEHLDFVNGSGGTIESGAPVKIGNIVGIALGKVLDGEKGVAKTKGVFNLKKKASLAITAGDPVYWDASPGEITKTAGDGYYIGCATADAASSATTVEVIVLQDAGQASIPVAATVAAVSTANATDLATAEALANQLKTTVNAILTSIKAAGLMS